MSSDATFPATYAFIFGHSLGFASIIMNIFCPVWKPERKNFLRFTFIGWISLLILLAGLVLAFYYSGLQCKECYPGTEPEDFFIAPLFLLAGFILPLVGDEWATGRKKLTSSDFFALALGVLALASSLLFPVAQDITTILGFIGGFITVLSVGASVLGDTYTESNGVRRINNIGITLIIIGFVGYLTSSISTYHASNELKQEKDSLSIRLDLLDNTLKEVKKYTVKLDSTVDSLESKSETINKTLDTALEKSKKIDTNVNGLYSKLEDGYLKDMKNNQLKAGVFTKRMNSIGDSVQNIPKFFKTKADSLSRKYINQISAETASLDSSLGKKIDDTIVPKFDEIAKFKQIESAFKERSKELVDSIKKINDAKFDSLSKKVKEWEKINKLLEQLTEKTTDSLIIYRQKRQ